MATLADKTSLLLFRVGPVLCCAPSLSVVSIILPPRLTHPPGSSSARPGIFKHGGQIVASLDLRYKFGVDDSAWVTPGRMIITQLKKGQVGFWVDEILHVIELPQSGWGPLPPLLPRGIFSRTLLLEKNIYLYAEFEALHTIPDSGYLRVYIQHLLDQQHKTAPPQTAAVSVSVPVQEQTHKQTSNRLEIAAGELATPPIPSARPVTATATPKPSMRAPASVPTSAPTPRSVTSAPSPVQRTPAAPPKQAAVVQTQLRSKPAAHKPATVPDTKPARPARQQPGNSTGVWLLLILFLALIAGGSWLLFDTGESPPVQSSEVKPPPQRVNSGIPAAEATGNTSAHVATEPPAVPVTDNPTAPSDSRTETISDPVTEVHTSAESGTAAYRASIEKDPHGFTIVIDAPEDSDIFKPESIGTVSETATTPDKKDSTTDTNSAHNDNASTDLQAGMTPAPQTKPMQKNEVMHIVVKGDTLWHIALRYLNNPYLYPELARMSNIENPDLIYPGDRVRIIKRSKKSDS